METIEMHRYLFEYDGRQLSVVSRKEITREKQIETAKELIIKEYGNFDKNKLRYISGKLLFGNVEA